MRICVNTQTPPLKFRASDKALTANLNRSDAMIDVRSLKEGSDFEYSPGGVTRMVLPLLARMIEKGLASEAHWICLNPGAPSAVRLDRVIIHHVNLRSERRAGYGLAKEALWRVFHGLTRAKQDLLWADDFVDYTFYNRVSAELIRSLDVREDFDLFYVHDFQQLPVGHMLQTLKPKVLRWHIPFHEDMIPSEWKVFLSTYLESYDAVIVSCQSYQNSLKSMGYKGEAFYVYPYVDETVYGKAGAQDLAELKARLNLHANEKTILLVARLDPMKGQDVAIKAIPEVLKEVGEVKLILVGNGSFSSSKHGLAISKAEDWLSQLRKLVKSLHLEDNVVFGGYMSQRMLNAAYELCDMTILPSRQEGFGLVVVESWLYRKPTVVSTKAGIAELIDDGGNGFLVAPSDPHAIAEKMSRILTDEDLAENLGEGGFRTSRKCLISEGLEAEWKVISTLV